MSQGFDSPLRLAYMRLVELARREAELVGEGRFDEVIALQEERELLQAALPEDPPREAAPLLEEAACIVRSTEAELAVALADTGAALRRLAEGRRAASAYGAASGNARPSLNRYHAAP